MPRLAIPAVLLGSALCPGPAGAHAILMDSQPTAGAMVPAGPVTLRLRFNSRIDHLRSRLVLRAGQTEAVLPLAPASPADVLAAPASLAPGAYVIRWQVLATDGHITRGDVPFTVQGR